MARKLRIQYPGAIYHVMNRGDHREAIFRDDQDRMCFLETLGEACDKTGWIVHVYCLMSNHFHLVTETPQPNLVAGMKWLLSTYTCRYNHRHKEVGHLFSGRYKALVVDGSGDGYLKAVCDYVHLNPVRANLAEVSQSLSEYAWSSYPLYLAPPSRRPSWLRVDRLLGEWGILKDSEAGRKVFAERMERRRREPPPMELKPMERGWCFGGEQFRKELLEQVESPSGRNLCGEAMLEAEEVHAARMLAEALNRLGWTQTQLKKTRKGASQKLELAVELRRRTTMSIAWIAERLSMGSPGYLASLLCQSRKEQTGQEAREELRLEK